MDDATMMGGADLTGVSTLSSDTYMDLQQDY